MSNVSTHPCIRGRWSCRLCPLSPYRGAAGVLVDARGHAHALSDEPYWIGRDPGCALVLAGSRVSRWHCLVRKVPGGHQLVDLTSGNGTLANGERVAYRLLREGDAVGVGAHVLTYHAHALGLPVIDRCPLPTEQPDPLALVAALYDEQPDLPLLRGAMCPLCGHAALPAGDPSQPPRLVQLLVLARHLETCPARPASFRPPPPARRPVPLATGSIGVDVELLPPPLDAPEALVRATGPDGALALGLLRVDGKGAPALRAAAELAARLGLWLERGTAEQALRQLDRHARELTAPAGAIACGFVRIDPSERNITFHQAGGLPLVRLRRFACAPTFSVPPGPPPGVVHNGAACYAGESLGWPIDETLVLLTPGLAQSEGNARLLRTLGVLASGRGVLSLEQLAPALAGRGLAREGSVLQIRMAPAAPYPVAFDHAPSRLSRVADGW